MASKMLMGTPANFTRVGMAIVDELTQILRDLLASEIPQTKLVSAVQACKKLNLNTDQQAFIAGAASNGYSKFDVTLLYTLLRNICSTFGKPTRGWGGNIMPKPNHVGVADDIERIRIFRNIVYAHLATTAITDSDFNMYWSTITNICTRLETYLGGNSSYTADIQKIKTCIIDNEMYEHYKQELEDMQLKDQELLKKVNEVAEDVRYIRNFLHVKEKEKDTGIPVVEINGQNSVVYGQNACFIAYIQKSSSAVSLVWQKTDQGSHCMRLDIHTEKYSGSSDNIRKPILFVKKCDFADRGSYQCVVSSRIGTTYITCTSNKVTLNVTGGRPNVNLLGIKNINGDLEIECDISVSPESPAIKKIVWQKDAIEIQDKEGHGQKHSLVIRKADETDIGCYKCLASNDVGETSSQTIKLDVPVIAIKGQEKVYYGETAIFDGTITSILDIQNVQWRGGPYENYVDICSEPYQGSSVSITNPKLVIKAAKFQDEGSYYLFASNVLGGGRSSCIDLLVERDDVLQMSLESQTLLCLLLQRPGELDITDPLLLRSYNTTASFFGGEEVAQLPKPNSLELNQYIKYQVDTISFKSLDMKRKVLESFTKKSGFPNFFIKNSDVECLKTLFRSPKYKTEDENEIFHILNMEETENMVDRLQLEMLSHITLTDESIHDIVSKKLQVPKEVLLWGKDGLKNFLKHLKSGTQKIYHIRGMIVGCNGVGKTTLLKKLKDMTLEEILDTDSTRGVDIYTDVFTIEDDTLTVNTEGDSSYFSIDSSSCLPEVHSAEHKDINIPVMQNRNTELAYESNDESLTVREATSQTTKPSQKSPKPNKFFQFFKNIKSKVKKTRVTEKDIESDKQINVYSTVITSAENVRKGKQPPYFVQTSRMNIPSMVKPVSEDSDTKPKLTPRKKNRHVDTQTNILSLLPSVVKDQILKRISLLDFAGQPAYYACHQVYLSPRAIYVLVIDITKDLDDIAEMNIYELETSRTSMNNNLLFSCLTNREFLQFWMYTIHAYSSSTTPVILVATHCENKTEEEVRNFFKAVWKCIPKPIRACHFDPDREFGVELLTDRHVGDLKRCIATLVQKQSHWGETVPLCWCIFESKFKEIQIHNKVLQIDEVWLINANIQDEVRLQTSEDMAFMLQFFHDTGSILHFNEESLRQYIILDVQWFVDAFKHVITDPTHAKKDLRNCIEEWEKFNQSGMLQNNLLDAIWENTDPSYLEYKQEVVLYMERLGMMAHIRNDMWYVPCMNKLKFPTAEFDLYKVSPTFSLEFEFLPGIIFYRLIVLIMNTLHWNLSTYGKNEIQCVFRNASVFQHKENQTHNILIGMRDNVIDLQVLCLGEDLQSNITKEIRWKISKLVEQITKTFHSNIKICKIGYRCKISPFEDANEKIHVIEESTFSGDAIVCPKCELSEKEKIDAKAVLSLWEIDQVFEDKEIYSSVGYTEVSQVSREKEKENEGREASIQSVDPQFYEWYFDEMSARECERLLELQEQGTFLVRKSESWKEKFVLSVAMGFDDLKPLKTLIHYDSPKNIYYMNLPFSRNSLPEFIRDLRGVQFQYKGMLKRVTLKKPCPRPMKSKQAPIIPKLQNNNLHKRQILASGKFADVYKGIMKGGKRVAIKVMKPNIMSVQECREKIEVLQVCNHDKLIEIYGYCEEPVTFVMEFAVDADLLTYIRANRKNLGFQDLLDKCVQVASGMKFLEERGIVHKCLTARKVMHDERKNCKVSIVCCTEEIKDMIDTIWGAPEIKTTSLHSSKSDVWSYGTVLIEILSKGSEPSTDKKKVTSIKKPELCPQTMYEKIQECWRLLPKSRPTFEHLYYYIDDYDISPETQMKEIESVS